MMHENLTGEVSSLAFGGQGIIRNEGLVTFIPFAAIGDTLSYDIIEKRKNFAKGKIQKILQPSRDRTTPKCPYFGSCGGCQLQHLTYQAQLSAKRQWIEDAIWRQAKCTDVAIPPVIPTTQQWEYRRKVVLTLRPKGGHYLAGYIATDHTSLLHVEHCAIFADASQNIFTEADRIVKKLEPVDATEAKLTILKKDETHFLLHFHFKAMPKNAQKVLDSALKEYDNIVGIVATSQRTTCRAGFFDTSFSIDDLTIDFSPQAFIQNHPEQSLKIYRDVCDHVIRERPRKLLDLYCGIGITSLLIAKMLGDTTKIIGVEANGEAVRLANDNAKKNNISNATFTKAYVEEVMKNLLTVEKPEVVIANPPREGLAPEAVKLLTEAPPKTLIYISCMPATLARDIKLLCEKGYTLQSIHGYDMFPQTTHVETLAVLIDKRQHKNL